MNDLQQRLTQQLHIYAELKENTTQEWMRKQLKDRKYQDHEDKLLARVLAKRQADPMSTEDVAHTPRSSTNSPLSDQINNIPVVPTQSDALSEQLEMKPGRYRECSQ